MRARRPIVIAHRGASGYRPEHTLAGYALAIAQGADVIEPDLVTTRDGVLIARHENEIGSTTDVASRTEFASRRTTKRIDGTDVTGWFAEDFTLAEIKTLRARERLPLVRPDNVRHDGLYDVPTLREIVALANSAPRAVAIYPETKHPTYFAHEGRHLDGTPIERSLGSMLIETLVAEQFTDPTRVYVQSFEVANLLEMEQRLMPEAGVAFPLMQLFGDTSTDAGSFTYPYDIRYHASRGDDLAAIYGDLAAALGRSLGATTSYGDLAAPAALRWLRENYATGIAPWINNLLPRLALDRDDRGIGARLTGAVSRLVADAHSADLLVHCYTLRAERAFRVLDSEGEAMSVEDEARLLLALGVDGYFIDQPDLGVAARDAFRRS